MYIHGEHSEVFSRVTARRNAVLEHSNELEANVVGYGGIGSVMFQAGVFVVYSFPQAYLMLRAVAGKEVHTGQPAVETTSLEETLVV